MVESKLVELVVAGSSPVGHPNFNKSLIVNLLPKFHQAMRWNCLYENEYACLDGDRFDFGFMSWQLAGANRCPSAGTRPVHQPPANTETATAKTAGTAPIY